MSADSPSPYPSLPPSLPPVSEGIRWRGLPATESHRFLELVKAVRAGLPRLSPRQAAVGLGVWAGLSEPEVAGWLGCAEATVHQHYRSALGRVPPGGDGKHRRADLILAVERALVRQAGRKGRGSGAGPSSDQRNCGDRGGTGD